MRSAIIGSLVIGFLFGASSVLLFFAWNDPGARKVDQDRYRSLYYQVLVNCTPSRKATIRTEWPTDLREDAMPNYRDPYRDPESALYDAPEWYGTLPNRGGGRIWNTKDIVEKLPEPSVEENP